MKTNTNNRKDDVRRNIVRKQLTNRRRIRRGRGRKAAKANVKRHFTIEQLEARQLLASDCGPNNLIQNCSFEDALPPAAPPTAAEIFHVIPAGSTAIANWQPDSHPDDPNGNIDWVRKTAWIPSDGNLSIDLSGTPGRGRISQTVATIPGTRYELTFDLAANPVGRFHPNGSNPTKTLQVSAAGQSQVFSYTLSPTADGNNLAWETTRWSFVATSTSTTLEFLAIGPDPLVDNDPNDNADFGAAIDRIHLTQATTGSIHGVAYEDLDGDGVRDPSDPGLDGKRIHLLNFSNTPFTLDGALDTNPIFGQPGAYVFAELPPATYRVHEIQHPGWVSTLPPGNVSNGATGFHVIDFQQGEVLAGISFPSAALGSIHGFKFEDLNTNGVYEESIDRPQSGAQFVLSGVTGLGVEVNRVATTDAAGLFGFEDLLPSVSGQGQGTGYTITEVVPDGFYATTPNPLHADLYSGKELVAFQGQAMLPETVTVEIGSKLRGDRSDAERMAGPFAADLPVGDYTLTLVSSDFGPDHGTQGQNNEQYFLQGFDASNNIVFQSPPIDDLPNHLNQLTQVVAQRLRLGRDVVAVKAVHISALGVPGTNSIDPVRAIFEPLDPRVEEPAELFFGNARTSTISGQKFRDLDADGQRDAGEPGLNGWTVQLVDTRTGDVVQEVVTQATDEIEGIYTFSNVVPGDFEIREIEQSGWMQTFPRGGSYPLTIGANQNRNGFDFGNSKLASIHGTKFEDVDGDGQRDTAEPGLNRWHVQLIDAETGRVVQEQLTHSLDGAPGQYWFRDVAPGAYEVRENSTDSWRQTFPASGNYSLVVGLEQEIGNLDFGNTVLGSIHGFKFEDIDGNGHYDLDVDAPMAGIEFRLDGTDGLGAEVQQATRTNEQGYFSFTGLSASVQGEGSGTGYTIAEVVPPGTEPTTSTMFTADLFSRQELVAFEGQAILGTDNDPRVEVRVGTDLMFGNRRINSEIQGFKFEDLNGDGAFDAAESGMGGVVIYIDQNANGRREFDETFVLTAFDEPATPEDETGRFSFTGLPAGDYIVAEESPRGFEQSFPVDGAPHVVELDAGETVSGLLFGNKELTNFGNVRFAQVHGLKFHDLNANGQRDPGEPGLAGVTIDLAPNHDGEAYLTESMEDDPNTPDDETGMFWFLNVKPGAYTLQEVLPTGWFNTIPGPGGQQVVVGSGEIADGLLIGNAQFASIEGLKYNDQNGNARRDAAEPGVPGIVVYADLNGNGILEAGEPATRTMEDDPTTQADETGKYRLENLRPGSYLIREVITQDYVVQTAPGGELLGHEVILNSGQVQTGIDFGNTHLCSVHGWKWEDLDLDGRIDPTEPGVSGVTIYADLNRNGMLDEGEPATQSMADDPTTPRDETGQYWLQELLPGEYLIREIVPEGWVNVFPVGGSRLVVLENCGGIGPSMINIAATSPDEIQPPSVPTSSVARTIPIPNDSPMPAPAVPRLDPIANDQQDVSTLTVQISEPFVATARFVSFNLDVSSDGIISEHDVQLIVEDIRENGLRALDHNSDGDVQDNWSDVNHDGWVAPMDVLLVINAVAISSYNEDGSFVEFAALERPVMMISEPAGVVRELTRSTAPRKRESSTLRGIPSITPSEPSRPEATASRPATRSSSVRETALDELLNEGLLGGSLDGDLLRDLLL